MPSGKGLSSYCCYYFKLVHVEQSNVPYKNLQHANMTFSVRLWQQILKHRTETQLTRVTGRMFLDEVFWYDRK